MAWEILVLAWMFGSSGQLVSWDGQGSNTENTEEGTEFTERKSEMVGIKKYIVCAWLF